MHCGHLTQHYTTVQVSSYYSIERGSVAILLAVDCGVPLFPSSGSISVLTSTVTNTTVGAALAFQCEEGLLSPGFYGTIITCMASGRWRPNPATLVCRESGLYVMHV